MTIITGELKSRVDKLWEEFWTGGIANPLTVIEQITFLMFARLLDITETRNEKRAARTKKPFNRIFSDDQQHLRWSNLKHEEDPKRMHQLIKDELFPLFKTIGEIETPEGKQKTTFNEYFKDARLEINKPELLVSAFNMIDALPLTEGDTKGDLYEYLLSKLTTAGINGQFRTPRHIIRLMVEMLDPKPNESMVDPACGTAGFLVGVMDHLLRKHTDKDGAFDKKLEANWEHVQTGMFHGFDFDATMLRIAAMNMLLHGVDSPDIHYQDTLGTSFTERFPKQAENGFDIVLANPPFKGALDFDSAHPSLLRKVKTKKTELLFVALILRMLKNGGRCAMIVPDGVLFGSSKAHQSVRQQLVDENQLEGVVSLPAGVFRPYAGVKTAILIFTKGGRTDNVWFFDLRDDGFSLDDRRNQLYDSEFAGDLPEVLNVWKNRNPSKESNREKNSFFVSADEIKAERYDLSTSRYRIPVYKEEKYDPPAKILSALLDLEISIAKEIEGLRGAIE